MEVAIRCLCVCLTFVSLVACDRSSLSGKYGGKDCAYELTFSKKGTVYVQILGMTEMAAQYRVDGDKVIVNGTNGPSIVVFTKEGDTLKSMLMGRPMVCRKSG